MPTYEYACQACGHELEISQRITESALKTCPECGKDQLERLISGGGFILKGGGWYKDGYGSSPGGKKRTENDRIDRLGKAITDDKKKTEGGGGSSSGGSSSSSGSSSSEGGGGTAPASGGTPSSGGSASAAA